MQLQAIKHLSKTRVSQINTAFILAGGKGERLKSLTANLPKVLIEVKGLTVLEWNLLNLVNYGIKKVVLGLGVKAKQVIDFIEENNLSNNYKLDFEYSVEKKPLGTAGALKLAETLISDENFMMCNGDEVKDIQYDLLFSVHNSNNAIGTLALVKITNTKDFGSVRLEGDRIVEFKEKTRKQISKENLVSAGAYILNKKVFSFIQKNKKVSIEKQVFPLLARKKSLFGAINFGQWYPIDSPEKLEKARKEWLGF